MPKQCFWRSKLLAALGVQSICLICLMGALATPALAHRVLVFAYAEGDTIHTESKFIPNTPVRQGKIEVLDQKSGKVLLTGQTDDQGKFSFKIPAEAAAQKLDLEIVVEAALGHRGSWLFKAANYVPGPAPEPAAAPAPAAATTPAAGAKSVSAEQQAWEAALNKALERQLAPLNEKLTELTIHRTSATDIIGGIGYILGLCGLGAYFLSRRKTNP